MADVPRGRAIAAVRARLRSDPVVMLLGPRQCGKTTLARAVASSRKATMFDLEAPGDLARLSEPMIALQRLRGLVIIDEAQLLPELFPVLRVLADRKPLPARFLLLGSASPDLARAVSESLAGRVALVPMGGFDLDEVGAGSLRRLWSRGGFPRSFLARSEVESGRWRADFVQTFLERDLARFGVQVAPQALRRLWLMASHYHGQVLNSSELGRSLGEAHTTIRRHLDILCGAFVMRLLPPWFENLGKRQIKSPKLYVRDSGILHSLLGIESLDSLELHPKLGASWEGFALEHVLTVTGDRDAYFWGTQAGAELDLLVVRGARRHGFEFKYADAPRVSRSMQVALESLRLERLCVVHPGEGVWPLGERVDAVGLTELRGWMRKQGWK
ncbi:MAG: ATP-binding protein [Planctomycetota bacterium]